MDINSPTKKESSEVTRESLIAISSSYSPDKIVDSNPASESKKSDGVVRPKGDQDDEFSRSELISISYVESPDVKAPPIAMDV